MAEQQQNWERKTLFTVKWSLILCSIWHGLNPFELFGSFERFLRVQLALLIRFTSFSTWDRLIFATTFFARGIQSQTYFILCIHGQFSRAFAFHSMESLASFYAFNRNLLCCVLLWIMYSVQFVCVCVCCVEIVYCVYRFYSLAYSIWLVSMIIHYNNAYY